MTLLKGKTNQMCPSRNQAAANKLVLSSQQRYWRHCGRLMDSSKQRVTELTSEHIVSTPSVAAFNNRYLMWFLSIVLCFFFFFSIDMWSHTSQCCQYGIQRAEYIYFCVISVEMWIQSSVFNKSHEVCHVGLRTEPSGTSHSNIERLELELVPRT